MERDEVERELQAERQANKKFGALRSALRSSRKSRVALRLRFNSIDGEKETEREVDEEPDIPEDGLSTSSKQTDRRSMADFDLDAVDKSDAEVNDEAESISTGVKRKTAAPPSVDDQNEDNYPLENSDTEEMHTAQTRTLRSGQSEPSKLTRSLRRRLFEEPRPKRRTKEPNGNEDVQSISSSSDDDDDCEEMALFAPRRSQSSNSKQTAANKGIGIGTHHPADTPNHHFAEPAESDSKGAAAQIGSFAALASLTRSLQASRSRERELCARESRGAPLGGEVRRGGKGGASSASVRQVAAFTLKRTPVKIERLEPSSGSKDFVKIENAINIKELNKHSAAAAAAQRSPSAHHNSCVFDYM